MINHLYKATDAPYPYYADVVYYAIFVARDPRLSLGGIRFKCTRQWFRNDTIRQVASFFAKLLPHWEHEDS